MSYRPNPNALSDIEKRIGQVLLVIAIEVQSEETNSLGRSYPPASKPGEFPARRTGNLQSSILYEPDSLLAVAKKKLVRIGYAAKAWYGGDLEVLRARKGLVFVMEKLKGKLEALVGAALKRI